MSIADEILLKLAGYEPDQSNHLNPAEHDVDGVKISIEWNPRVCLVNSAEAFHEMAMQLKVKRIGYINVNRISYVGALDANNRAGTTWTIQHICRPHEPEFMQKYQELHDIGLSVPGFLEGLLHPEEGIELNDSNTQMLVLGGIQALVDYEARFCDIKEPDSFHAVAQNLGINQLTYTGSDGAYLVFQHLISSRREKGLKREWSFKNLSDSTDHENFLRQEYAVKYEISGLSKKERDYLTRPLPGPATEA